MAGSRQNDPVILEEGVLSYLLFRKAIANPTSLIVIGVWTMQPLMLGDFLFKSGEKRVLTID